MNRAIQAQIDSIPAGNAVPMKTLKGGFRRLPSYCVQLAALTSAPHNVMHCMPEGAR